MIRFVVLLAVLCVCDGVKFGRLCHGNSANSMRTPDSTYGAGHFGASREGGETHEGLDIKCSDGSIVYAPFDVTLTRGLIVYPDDDNGRKAPINKGIRMNGDLCFSLFYVDPDRTSGTVVKGQRIGVMLPMQTVYRGIDSHVHVQMCDKSDPTPYF